MADLLEEALDEAEWSWLKEHAARGAVFVVAPELQLLDVARAVAKDEVAKVDGWVKAGQLARPSEVQLAAWNAKPAHRLLSLIVRPYVLVQEKKPQPLQ